MPQPRTKTESGQQIKRQALKVGLVALLFYFLWKKDLISVHATAGALSKTELMLPAFAALILAQLLGVVRWRLLLLAQNYSLSWWMTFKLTYIGIFFNLALPGAVSGDVVKAYYAGREISVQKGRVFGTILFDRVAGLSALALVSAGALALDFNEYVGTPLFGGIHWLILASALGVATFYGYLFSMSESHDLILRALRRLQGKLGWMSPFTRIYEGVRHYHGEKKTVLSVLALSMTGHALICTAGLLFATALGAVDLNFLAVAVIIPLGLLVTALPLTPGGIGTGHVAFGWLFLLLGSQRGADIFNLFLVGQVIGACIGGLLYLTKPQDRFVKQANS